MKKTILSMFLAAALVFGLGAAGVPGFTPVSTAQAISGGLLPPPSILFWDETTLSAVFSRVEGATAYTVTLSKNTTEVYGPNVPQPATGTMIYCSFADYFTGGMEQDLQGEYTFSVSVNVGGSVNPSGTSYPFNYPTPTPRPGTLPDPANPVWDEATFSAVFDRVADATNYVITLKKGITDLAKVIIPNPASGDTVSHGFKTEIENAGSGAYFYSVVARGLDGKQSNEAPSNAFNYTDQTDKLPTPGNPVWNTANFSAVFNRVADAESYLIMLYKGGSATAITSATVPNPASGGTVSHSFKTAIESAGPGAYTYTVMAGASGYMNSDLATSSTFNHSAKTDTDETNDTIKGQVGGILGGLTDGTVSADAARAALKGLDSAALADAMRTDKSLADIIRRIEEKYIQEKGITTGVDVDPAVAGQLNGNIDVVGLGLNAASGASNVALKFSPPNQEAVLDGSQYSAWIQFEISVEGAARSGYLDVPIQITMPIPAGLSPDQLVILHYLQNGTYETIYPKINGNGTITFTVTRFSLFAFANQKSDTGSTDDSDSTTTPGPITVGGTYILSFAPAAKPSDSTQTYRVLSRLNVRAGAGINAGVISKLSANTIVTILEITVDGWGRIQLADGRAGWVSMRYLMPIDIASKPGDYTTTANLHVRAGTDTKTRSLAILPKGSRVTVIGAGQNGFVQIHYGTGIAYVHGSYLAAAK